MTDIPKKVFIVPYRNRPEQKFFFCKYMKFLLEHTRDYEIYFSHQTDDRSFNRGACRNIGFLAIKEKYPEDYMNITFIFNDLDTIPFNRIFDYETEPGIIKHYYGFTHSLGGIVVIKGEDFENINGYPNFWSWGLEDSCLQKRSEIHEMKIDRSDFYKIGSPQILQLFDGVERIINKKDPHKLKTDDGSNGLSTIYDLEYTIDKKSSRELDNIYDSLSPESFYININNFTTETDFEDDEYFKYDLREPTSKITSPDVRRKTNNVDLNPSNWSNIPYYPTTEERKQSSPPHSSNQPQYQPQSQPQPQPQYQVQREIPTQPIVSMPNKSLPPPPQNITIMKGRSRPIRSGLQAIQNGRVPIHPVGPITRHLSSTYQPSTMIQKTQTPVHNATPKTFKQMKQENVGTFPPKNTNTAGGASAINRINLRYRTAKI